MEKRPVIVSICHVNSVFGIAAKNVNLVDNKLNVDLLDVIKTLRYRRKGVSYL